MDHTRIPRTIPRRSATFDEYTLSEIRRAAATGIYDIRGAGAKRRLPHFDDLLVLGASISRYPLEGYRERCDTAVTLGARFAAQPVELKIPITIAGMSFGSLSAQAKEALGRGASAMGTSTTSGDGGMTEEERRHSSILVYQYLPSRYGMNPDDLRKADAIEIVVGGSVGHMSAFMAQKGRLVVLGDTGDALGDSLYEARIYCMGTPKSLGADCVEKKIKDRHKEELAGLLDRAGFTGVDTSSFKRYGSARKLYNFQIDHAELP